MTLYYDVIFPFIPVVKVHHHSYTKNNIKIKVWKWSEEIILTMK